jgi:DNA-binding NtrC family response regulator
VLDVWQAIHSLFTGIPNRIWGGRDGARPGNGGEHIPIVALVACEQDRQVLAQTSAQEPCEMHFVASREEAAALMNRLSVPVVVVDRDWPGTEWRTVVQHLAASPQRPCVILMSGVADEYLWQELNRCGGYDTLAKPLRAEDVARVIRLALSYWEVSSSAVVREPNSWR